MDFKEIWNDTVASKIIANFIWWIIISIFTLIIALIYANIIFQFIIVLIIGCIIGYCFHWYKIKSKYLEPPLTNDQKAIKWLNNLSEENWKKYEFIFWFSIYDLSHTSSISSSAYGNPGSLRVIMNHQEKNIKDNLIIQILNYENVLLITSSEIYISLEVRKYLQTKMQTYNFNEDFLPNCKLHTNFANFLYSYQ